MVELIHRNGNPGAGSPVARGPWGTEVKTLVFVYGTLKRGFPNHVRYLGRARLLGEFRTVEAFPLVLNGHRCSPCLVDCPGVGKSVRGEVYVVDAAMLDALDRLERTAATDGYHRRPIAVEPVAGPEKTGLTVHAYLKAAHLVDAKPTGNLSVYTPALGARYRPRR